MSIQGGFAREYPSRREEFSLFSASGLAAILGETMSLKTVTFRAISIINTASGGAGLTTVTTHVPHLLSIGDSVVITGVTGGSYSPSINGTFVVQSVSVNGADFNILSTFTSAGTHGYIRQSIDETGVVSSITGVNNFSWTVPLGVRWAYMSGCGGGQGGAGGYNGAGGGGGGGGASASCNELPLKLTPGEVLTITVGIGGLGGAIGAAGAAASVSTRISGSFTDTATIAGILKSGQYVPSLRPDNTTANLAQPGTLTAGGRGGYGGPLWGGGNSQTGDGGPAPGAGSSTGSPGGDGAVALTRGRYLTTGGAGGGGGGPASIGGSGGSDTQHQDNSDISNGVLDNASGGAGGSSHRGKGGLSGSSGNNNAGKGEFGYGFGGGGGGGKTGFAGGDGAPGYLDIMYWTTT